VISGKEDPRKAQAEIARSILAGMQDDDEDEEDEPLAAPVKNAEKSAPKRGRKGA
jgi:hypothetical protein